MLLSTGLAVGLACRRRALHGSTAGVAPGYVQGNLTILPKDLAEDFLRFCQQNPKPCPIIGVSEVGDPRIPARTSIACVPAGPFRGPMVVSMRPFTPAHAIRAIQITSRFPAVHGAPIHIGLPELIGIQDLAKPDYGDSVELRSDELPVFWACGVTPQAVIVAAKPSFAITHAPGRMLLTDLQNKQLAVPEER
jgi:uncharacterized protein YcsI (UPF0317 family)